MSDRGRGVNEDPITLVYRAITEHRTRYALEPESIAVTTGFRKRVLRRIGMDESKPYMPPEQFFGYTLVLDDGLPADPGFAIWGEPL